MKKLNISVLLVIFCIQANITNAITTLTYTNMNDIMPNGVLDTSKYPALYNQQVETYNKMDKSSDSAQKFAELWNWMVIDYRSKLSGGSAISAPSAFSATKEATISSDKSTQTSKAATKLLGGAAKGATAVATQIGTTALQNAVNSNGKIDVKAKESINSFLNETSANITKTVNKTTDHAVTLAGHSIDFDAGLISGDELEVYKKDAKADIIKDTGSIAGNILESAGHYGGEVTEYYLKKAGDHTNPEKINDAEKALAEAKENLESAKKLGSKDYLELAEKQVKEAEKKLEEAKTPNKYLQTLAESAGSFTKELAKTAGDFGKDAVTIVSDAKANELFNEADEQWNKIAEKTTSDTTKTSESNKAGGIKIDFDF